MAIRKVGTCEVKREIGRGGMGVVYEARQEALDRTVAIKALDAKLARSRELAERFKREGRAYAQLRHQAIVAVHDLVEKEDTLYLVTDFVDGADLTKVLAKGGTLPPECAAIVGARVAGALDYVHFNHLLHRDVKPANVMLSRDGEVKLMDFGIAKDQRETDLTRSGMLVGSPSYLAPEVLGGDPADAKADVWALGVTLYELVAGEKPFRGRDADELFSAIRRGSFRRVRSLAPDCPRRLARAIERCLESRPRARWKTAGALARELDACAAKLLAGMHPQARLVALMTHRGFAKEEDALTRIDAASLLATRAVDQAGEEGPTSPFILRRQRRRAVTAAVLVAVAAVLLGFWLMPLPFRF
ncbi:MAG TPA: serine/threonine-protein kinase [Anaeromyxobacteraceae bacterium]|nr:serine/threonine-protein kinase [Anaeromyxobacteraceae bacterium]